MRDKQRIAEAIIARHKILKAKDDADSYLYSQDRALYELLEELEIALGKTQQQIMAEAQARAEEMRLKAAAESVQR